MPCVKSPKIAIFPSRKNRFMNYTQIAASSVSLAAALATPAVAPPIHFGGSFFRLPRVKLVASVAEDDKAPAQA